MSTIDKSVQPAVAERLRRWRGAFSPARAVLVSSLAGWLLAYVVGKLLIDELQALRYLFLPASAGIAGCVGYLVRVGSCGSGRRVIGSWRRLAFAFTVGAMALTLLYGAFVVRIVGTGGRSGTFLVSWSRAAACPCGEVSARACIEDVLNLNPDWVADCWQHRWVVQLGLTLSYLVTLASLGALVGLVLTPEARDGADGYLNFDLWIERTGEACYRVNSRGKEGEGEAEFNLPEHVTSGDPWAPHLRGPLRGGPADAAAWITGPQQGEELFRTVFQGEVLQSFQSHLVAAEAKGRSGLRIRMHLNHVPELACLPWEYLHDGNSFLALSNRTSVVRYLELNQPINTLRVKPPLRILVMIAQPQPHDKYPELAADEELRRLAEALEPLGNRVVIERLEGATREALDRRLRAPDAKPIHVFHFIGHGGFSPIEEQGVLLFEDQGGKERRVTGEELAYLLRHQPFLRLAVLNACEGALSSPKDVFAGTAQSLVRQGVPAVIAMRRKIFDQTSLGFAEVFYQALAGCKALDACVGSARLSLHEQHSEEWGTPVLYLRATDDCLFALANQGQEA